MGLRSMHSCRICSTLLLGLVTILAATCTESKDSSCMSKDVVDGANESQTALLQVNSAKGSDQQQNVMEECVPTCRPNCPQSARPGKPCLPPPNTGDWPYTAKTAWRAELGDRIVKATSADVQENDCGGFDLWGDHVFCMNAMKETTDTIALSYGIEERDLWSEKMSNQFRVSPRLYDCFQDPAKSPPLAKTAPNGIGAGACAEENEACYEMPYTSNRICLGAAAGMIQGREFQTMASHLVDAKPLSAYVKMDVEGSEWDILDHLLQHEDLQDKIRTLDMEVHFGWSPGVDDAIGEERLRHEVDIFERLAKAFRVTGSTLEVYREGWQPQQCTGSSCPEPYVYTNSGFSVSQFAVSFVNRKLLSEDRM